MTSKHVELSQFIDHCVETLLIQTHLFATSTHEYAFGLYVYCRVRWKLLSLFCSFTDKSWYAQAALVTQRVFFVLFCFLPPVVGNPRISQVTNHCSIWDTGVVSGRRDVLEQEDESYLRPRCCLHINTQDTQKCAKPFTVWKCHSLDLWKKKGKE